MEVATLRGNHRFHLATLILSLLSLGIHYYIVTFNNSRDASLFIVIFSHRDNFESRQVIRDTWLSLIDESQVKAAFVVGSLTCDIATVNLLDPYSCDSVPLNTTQIANNSLYRASKLVIQDGSQVIQHGFSFKVT